MFGPEMRCMMLCMVIMNALFIFILTGYGSIGSPSIDINLDYNGHWGGFLTGILAGLCIPSPI
jgi:membrane associated rhomboid family serine protease